MDYMDEIPFEKQPPPGFFDVSEDTGDMAPPNFKKLRQTDVMGELRDVVERVSNMYIHTCTCSIH